MLGVLTGQSGNRKWRLFAVESCRRVLGNDFDYPQLEAVVEFGAGLAEDFYSAPWEERERIWEELNTALGEMCETLNCLAEAVVVAVQQERFLMFSHGRRVVESISAAYQVGVVGSNGDEQF